MTDAEILVPLKIDLGISVNLQDEYLRQLIALARELIRDEGITLDESIKDGMLLEMYAAFLYRSRNAPVDQTAATGIMPRSLRLALNNRLLREKGRVE